MFSKFWPSSKCFFKYSWGHLSCCYISYYRTTNRVPVEDIEEEQPATIICTPALEADIPGNSRYVLLSNNIISGNEDRTPGYEDRITERTEARTSPTMCSRLLTKNGIKEKASEANSLPQITTSNEGRDAFRGDARNPVKQLEVVLCLQWCY